MVSISAVTFWHASEAGNVVAHFAASYLGHASTACCGQEVRNKLASSEMLHPQRSRQQLMAPCSSVLTVVSVHHVCQRIAQENSTKGWNIISQGHDRLRDYLASRVQAPNQSCPTCLGLESGSLAGLVCIHSLCATPRAPLSASSLPRVGM